VSNRSCPTIRSRHAGRNRSATVRISRKASEKNSTNQLAGRGRGGLAYVDPSPPPKESSGWSRHAPGKSPVWRKFLGTGNPARAGIHILPRGVESGRGEGEGKARGSKGGVAWCLGLTGKPATQCGGGGAPIGLHPSAGFPGAPLLEGLRGATHDHAARQNRSEGIGPFPFRPIRGRRPDSARGGRGSAPSTHRRVRFSPSRIRATGASGSGLAEAGTGAHVIPAATNEIIAHSRTRGTAGRGLGTPEGESTPPPPPAATGAQWRSRLGKAGCWLDRKPIAMTAGEPDAILKT